MQENLLGLVEQAGVVGAGGAGFPTHVKLKAQADTVIINGAECEPLLRVDQQLMALQAGDLLTPSICSWSRSGRPRAWWRSRSTTTRRWRRWSGSCPGIPG